MRQYGEIIEETEKFYRYREAYRSSEFYVREIKVRINAHYVNDNKILYFTVSHSPYQDGDFIPFEAYKWCVDRGFKKVSDIAEAKRILACLDINSKFREKEFIG